MAYLLHSQQASGTERLQEGLQTRWGNSDLVCLACSHVPELPV